MKEPVNLISACSSNYIMPLSVMLVSVVENFDPERDLVIHVISNDATAQDRNDVLESIRKVRPGLEHLELCWHAIDDALLGRLPITEGSYLTRDAYARLFAPELLPARCERAIYLDCDVVVLRDIAELYDSTTNDTTVIHAVHDVGCPFVSSSLGIFNYVERGIPRDTRYFNSGVLVINLKRWRERNLTKQMLEYLHSEGDQVRHHDQEAMNAILHRDWTELDMRWNQISLAFYQARWLAAGRPRREWMQSLSDPFIVHYAGTKKPWLKKWRYFPRRIFFFRYLRKTVFKNKVAGFPYLESLLGYQVFFRLWLVKTSLFPEGIKGFLRPRNATQPTLAAIQTLS